MRSNLPSNLAVFRFFGKTTVFWFEAGTLLADTRKLHTHGEDGLGRRLQVYKGELLIAPFSGQADLKLNYTADQFHCAVGSPIILLFCNDYFVAYHDFQNMKHHWFGSLHSAVGSGTGFGDFFKPQYKTITWAIAALWLSGVFTPLTSVLLLHWRTDTFFKAAPHYLAAFCLCYFVPLAALNMALAADQLSLVKKRMWAILNHARSLYQQNRLPAAWHETQNQRHEPCVSGQILARAGLIPLTTLGLVILFVWLTTVPSQQPHLPMAVYVVEWSCVLAAGLLYTWALAATRLGRRIAWLVAVATIVFAGRTEPRSVEDVILAPLQWMQQGLHFWLVFLPLAALWFVVKENRVWTSSSGFRSAASQGAF